MKLILDTPLVQIHQTKIGYQMRITSMNGTIIEHAPFPPNLEGMVAAISLAAEIRAGKFCLSHVVSTPRELVQIGDHGLRKRMPASSNK